MPKVLICPHCKRSFMSTTYGMIAHFNKYHSESSKQNIKFINFNVSEVKYIEI